MRVKVFCLHHWKSEYDAQSSEDAWGVDCSGGVFAIADGAGTTLFARQWATVLVEHGLSTPLLSNDPFELEWWLRAARQRFERQAPLRQDMSWNALQKAQGQGSYSTFASVRISQVDASSAQATLLAIGDSCILHASGETLHSFPLEQPAQFEQAPLCLPTLARVFSRTFHRCQAQVVTLAAGDTLLLATDAVAKWIVSAGAGRYTSAREAMQVVMELSQEDWPTFIETCRSNGAMADDDSTALLLKLSRDNEADGVPLGTTSIHSLEVRTQRKALLEQALAEQQREQLAIFYGDGSDLREEMPNLAAADIEDARTVADALQEVLAALRAALENEQARSVLEHTWLKHRDVLYKEPCAQHLCATLTRIGIETARADTLEMREG